MIQELLGGSSKVSVTTVLEAMHSATPSSSSPSSSSASSNTITTSSSTTENLRCPRCDSSNTKFCYYNNYNLTQPRHFCKTCRRYWTKGGALRNVPIGGGCRKNKSTILSTCIAKSSTTKLQSSLTSSASDIGKLGFIYGLEHELSSNPILWSSTQNSIIHHPLSFLRSHNRNPNNPNVSPSISNPISAKNERFLLGSQISTGSIVSTLSQASPVGFCGSYLRNNQQQNQVNSHQSGDVLGETQSYTGLQEMYQRLRSSNNCFYPDHGTVMLSSVASSSSPSSTSTILESSPVAVGGEVGLWGNHLPLSDLLSTGGALP